MFVGRGANIRAYDFDVYSCWPDAGGVCLEPAPGAFTHFVSTLEGSGYAARCDAVVAGCTGESGPSSVPLLERLPDSCTRTTVEALAHAPTRSSRRWLRVPARCLDEIIGGFEGGIDCLRLAGEGAEYDIVTGALLDTLPRLRHVVVEYDPVPDREFTGLVDRFAEVNLVQCLANGGTYHETVDNGCQGRLTVEQLGAQNWDTTLGWTRWERSPELGGGVCWFAVALMGRLALGRWPLSTAITSAPSPTHVVREPVVGLVPGAP